MVTAAISSIAVIRVTIALCSANCLAPIARVTDNTVGIAIGIPPIKRTRTLSIPRR
ncbi:hypothetical protein BJ944DRAFT_273757 [Cunninghamella echinulata]|nr:hypothetical protein BJ944DRAFT_273757 [Cunninghamella echinulata]